MAHAKQIVPPEVPDSLDGEQLRRAFRDGAALLRARADGINALNVFPVPDGDTGTNMLLTVQDAIHRADDVSDPRVGTVAKAAAHGALLGARGNSGVILSQYLRGFARALEGRDTADAADLADALSTAAQSAYNAVVHPVEGTMLTVGRDAAEAGLTAVGDGLTAVLGAATLAARSSVARTPTLLPVLRQAGVVDAGAEGLLALLEGMWLSLRGETVAEAATTRHVAARLDDLHPVGEDGYGYCTQVLVEGVDLDIVAVRERVNQLGESAIVVGESDLIRVHVHTLRPGLVVDYLTNVGSLIQVRVDNMDEQTRARAAAPDRLPAPLTAVTAVVAVAAGAGLVRVLESLGAVVISGGQSANPSTDEILRAVDAVLAAGVVVLPNNSNALLAARQVTELSTKQVSVIPTRNPVEGIAAMMAFDREAEVADNERAMSRALGTVKTAEVTIANRDVTVGDVKVRQGEVIGIVGGQLRVAAENLTGVTLRLLDDLAASSSDMITLYRGQDLHPSEVESLAQAISQRFPNTEIDVVDGDQPVYHLLLSVE